MDTEYQQEAQQHHLELPEDDPEIITMVLLFVYTGDYSDTNEPTFGIDTSVSTTDNGGVSREDRSGKRHRSETQRDKCSNKEYASSEHERGKPH